MSQEKKPPDSKQADSSRPIPPSQPAEKTLHVLEGYSEAAGGDQGRHNDLQTD